MALSDEDRAAIRNVRAMMDAVPMPDHLDTVGLASLERVLKLAGEEREEPANGTFWLDEEGADAWTRDDRTMAGEGDLGRWFRTGDGEKFFWIDVLRISPKLVELVRVDEARRKARTILYELAGSWQYWHHVNCGRQEPLGNCQYHECVHRWQALLGYGLEENWES